MVKTQFIKFEKLLLIIPSKSKFDCLFVSERLKLAIEENGFTGMAFEEIEEVDKRLKVIY